VVKNSVQVLSQILRVPYVLAGAGCTEFHLAKHIQVKLEEFSKESPVSSTHYLLPSVAKSTYFIKRSMEVFTKCLETMATLSESEMPRDEVIDLMNSKEGLVGWDPIAKQPIEISLQGSNKKV
jgi:hypothetical protein